jgi:hypothetical protein
MSKNDNVILYRESLYKDVWETPILQLAKKYCMSDVGLAKICQRMKIPLPPRGYWAKRAHGHKVKKAPLPPIDDGITQVALDKTADEMLRLAKRRAVTSQQRQVEKQHIKRLKQEMVLWEESQKVRAYVAAMRSGRSKPDKAEKEWIAWAEQYASHLDPAVDFRIEVLDEV